jgi:hypothetical protein
MKVVFVDIDGVLNSTHTHNPRKFPYIADKKLVERLRRVLARARAKAVLTSTWRCDPVGLYAARFYDIPFIGCVPDMPHRPRHDEITAWLKAHPKVTRYAVLDDDDDELEPFPLFQPSATEGLSPKLAKALGDFLLKKTDNDMRRSAVVRLAENVLDVVSRHKG